jgi:hypothetical protein
MPFTSLTTCAVGPLVRVPDLQVRRGAAYDFAHAPSPLLPHQVIEGVRCVNHLPFLQIEL